MHFKSWFFAAVLSVFAAIPAQSQQSSPEAVAAAKALLVTMRAADQFKAILPLLMQQLKPAIAQGRPEVAAEYDKLVPIMIVRATGKLDKLVAATAELYAMHFSAAELRELAKFYETAAGKKFLEKMPEITRQSLMIGNRIGQEVALELQQEMTNELRNRGHKL